MPAWLPFGPEWSLVNVIALCFFVGACGKSAQLPLYVWLPDAMAGPTPVSALIHAATMVTAGVYMVCRLSFLYAAAPEASAVVAWTGGLTALFAATIAITQTDIKKVLAYSTVSQLGYMFLAAGCGGYSAAIFHLGTHAFFKALLFLGAGAVILAMHHEQDIDKMGGLHRKLWQTHIVFLMGVLAIAGFPGFSGFFSKDEILVTAFASSVPGHRLLHAIGLRHGGPHRLLHVPALLQDLLGRMPRAARAARSSARRGAGRDQSALGARLLVGLRRPRRAAAGVGRPDRRAETRTAWAISWRRSLAEGAHHAIEHATEYALAALAVGAAGTGALLAWLLYVARPALPERLAASLSGLHRLLLDKYWIDELYDAAIVRPLVRVSDRLLFRGVDAGLIDGVAVNGSARMVRGLAANGLKYAQSGLAQGYVFFMIAGAVAIVAFLLR